MDADRTIYMAPPQEVPEELFTFFTALPGRLAVAMYETPSRNGILMPGSGRLSPDMGRVISQGSPLAMDVEVLVKPYDGLWLPDCRGTGVEVRLYGVNEPWYDSVVAMRQGDMVIPTHDWVLLRRKKVESAILLLDGYEKFLAEVVFCGQACKYVSDLIGKEVVYTLSEYLIFKMGGSEDWILVKERDIHGFMAQGSDKQDG